MINTLKIKILELINKVFTNLENDNITITESIKNKIINNIKNYSPDNFFKQIESPYNYIENVYFFPDITYDKVDNMISESLKNGYAATLVPQSFIKYTKSILNSLNSKHHVATYIDFPFGTSLFESKIEIAKTLFHSQVNEIEIVMNIPFLREKRYFYIFNELYDIKNILKDKVTKVIIENSFLNFEQKIEAAVISYLADYDYICNTTNYGPDSIKLENIVLMKMIYGNKKIKAAGDINTIEYVKELLNHGADRIGLINPAKLFK